jgi:2'-5' RNA ligase
LLEQKTQLYFIAIVPPEPVFSEIRKLKEFMANQYSSDAALRSPAHITLHMPFQWKQEKEERIFDALDNFAKQQRSFEVKLNGFGCFEPRVIYVNVDENVALRKMQEELMDHAKINLNLFNANYREQPFHPHITIAFRNLKKSVFPEAWKEFQNKKYAAEFFAGSFSLLKHNGKGWDIYKEFKINP